MASIKQEAKPAFNVLQEIALRKLLAAVKADIVALQAANAGVNAQLDADGGVTDTDYAANWDVASLNIED